jgi:predicted PurR-regulated permease PerM
MAPSDQFVKSAWMLAAIAVVVAALYLAKGLLVPLTLAVLLSFLLSPVCDWLERRGWVGSQRIDYGRFWVSRCWAVAWTALVRMTELAPKCRSIRTTRERSSIR